MKKQTGFTLVELLIVIALIAILSVAVLATINPIEQSNKARDAKFKNDTAEVLSAYERYYAGQNAYPWNNQMGTWDNDSNPATPEVPIAVWAVGQAGVLTGLEVGFGVLDGAGNPTGELITTSELKSSFGAKEPFSATVTNTDKLYVYHNGSDNNYVCFCPKANANRVKRATLKCISDAAGSGAGLSLLDYVGTAGTCGALNTPAFEKGSTYCDPDPLAANMMCVPEGAIN